MHHSLLTPPPFLHRSMHPMATLILPLLLTGMVLAALAARAPFFYPTFPPSPSPPPSPAHNLISPAGVINFSPSPPPSPAHNLISPVGVINLHPLTLDNVNPTSMDNIVPKPPQKSVSEKFWMCVIGVILFFVVISTAIEFLKKLWKQNRTFLLKIYAKLRPRPANVDVEEEEIFYDAPEEFMAPKEEENAPAPVLVCGTQPTRRAKPLPLLRRKPVFLAFSQSATK